jgi:hypothetical protein
VPELWTLGVIGTTVKFTPVFIAVSMFLVACGRQNGYQELSGDAKIRREIVGTWLAANGVVDFTSDGRSSARFTNGSLELAYETKWEASGGDVITTITKVTGDTTNHESVGAVEKVRIISVDASNLVWDYNGLTMSFKRKQ